MMILGLVLAGLAAVLHVFIFYLESIAWTSARARATFGTSEEEVEVTKSMAFNQGFYNLFLALAVFIGIIICLAGAPTVGLALVFTGVGSMLAAALVLIASSPDLATSATKQGLLPLLSVASLIIGITI